MAIERDLNSNDSNNNYGINFTSVYYKIDACIIDFMKEQIRISVRGYASQEARQSNSSGIFKKNYIVSINDSDSGFQGVLTSRDQILTAAYNYIKNLPDFIGGVDV